MRPDGCPACGKPNCRLPLTHCTNSYCQHGPPNDQPTPGLTHGGACPKCLTFADRALKDFPEQYIALYLALDKPNGHGERISGSCTAPTPVNEGTDALMWDVCGFLEGWETVAREKADLRVRSNRHEVPPYRAIPKGARSTRAGWSITRSVATIRAHIRYLTDEETASTFLDELATLRRRVINHLGAYRGKTRSNVPCPHCDLKAVVRVNGTEQYDCEACGSVFVEQDFDRYAKLLVWRNGATA